MTATSRRRSLHCFISPSALKAMITVFILFLSQPVLAETPLADITISGNSVSVYSSEPDTTFMMLRIQGPNGNLVCNMSSRGTPFSWAISSETPDGRYKWEVKASATAPRSNRTENVSPTSASRPWLSSGSFQISNNAILIPTKEETGFFKNALHQLSNIAAVVTDFLLPSAHADIIHADDVIIGPSLCVGSDCVNGEAFGFDTIRVKENNVRFHFDDTSTTAGIPNNDWRIVINDTTSGGASYFGVEDSTAARRIFTLEAGAPVHSLYVDDGGRVGLGTSTPVVELHVVDGDSPTLRLEQDGSSGFTAQTWDVVGNETNFFIRDASNGSTLPFRIRPGAPSNTLYLKENGNVGIGEDNPSEKLHVDGNALIVGNLDVGSSRSFKQDIHEVSGQEALEALTDLSPVHFSYRSSPDVHSIGFIAEDVPDLVATSDRKSLRPMDMVALLTKVTQEQQKTIESLSGQITALQMQVQSISAKQD